MSQNDIHQLGNYRLIRLLGQGGFADVYLGRHIHLKSYAAVKILHLDLSIELIREFKKEAQTIAELTHPNIIRVLDFDVQDDIPFLIMEYAPFGSLREQYKSGAPAPLPAIVSYVNQVARALQYAHEHRVIHRDVKPENMLIGKDHRILLSDFGLALLAENSLSRQSTLDAAGTIAYMAPEQIQGKPRPASDQYALAVTVYEWLCGTRPFTGTLMEVTTQHLTAPPPPLRKYVPSISPEIEKVIRQALAKEPARRFPSVQSFAEALEEASGVEPRPLSDENFSTAAAPPAPRTAVLQENSRTRELASARTIIQRQPKAPIREMPKQPFISRRTLLFGIIALVGVGGTGLALATLHASTTPPQVISKPGQAITPTATATASPAKPTATPTHTPTAQATPTQPQAPQPTQNPVAVGTLLSVFHGHTNTVYSAAWSPDGTRIVSGGADTTVQLWHAADGGSILSYTGHSKPVLYVSWSPDGTQIASASDDATVHVWDAITGILNFICTGHANSVHSAAWSPDGKYIASGSSDTTVRIWDGRNGNLLMTYSEHSATVWGVAWSPDGTKVASASGSIGAPDHTVKIWDIVTGTTIVTYTGHTDRVIYPAWSPGGKRVASGSFDNTVQVWDATTGSTQLINRGHSNTVYGVAWSPGGARVASGSADTTVLLWNVVNNTTFRYTGHSSFVFGVAWSPDGTRIASASDDRTVQVWQA